MPDAMTETSAPRPPAVRIAWHRRLEARVLVSVGLVVGLSLVSLLFAARRTVQENALERAAADLLQAEAAFSRLLEQRAEFASAQARLITDLPVFRARMVDARGAADRDTMAAMAETYRRDLSAAFVLVTDASGQWLAGPGLATSTDLAERLAPGIDAALASRATHEIIAVRGKLYLVVYEPAGFAADVLGVLVAAYQLDDAVARELARTTRSEVVLVADGAIAGTSLLPAARASLGESLAGLTAPAISRSVTLVRLAGGQFVANAFALDPDGQGRLPDSLVLLQDWEPTQAFLDDVRGRLLSAGLTVFLLAIAGSFILSRSMSRPLSEIADVAEDIAAGNWARRVPARGTAEAVAMADAFNAMTTSLGHWHQQASAQTEQLQSSYERFYAVTQSAHDAIVSTDRRGEVVFWNTAAEVVFGYQEREAVGAPFLSMLAPSTRAIWTERTRRPAQGGEGADSQTFEGEGIRRDGTTFPFELSLSHWKSGDIVYATAIVRDITERRRSEEALRQRDEQLRQAQKMEAIGRLASGVAHDFNNSLAVIHGYAEQLMLDVDPADERYHELQEILRAAQSAAALTRQLLAFSRKQVLQPQVVDLGGVVTGVQRMLARLVGSMIDLQVHVAPGLGPVWADPGQLEQVVMNLVINARDAMRDGGRITIELANADVDDPLVCRRLALDPGAYVTIAVADTGHGMTPEVASRIFEPFFTTKDAGKGTGLGLATVFGIVNQSGGAIDLETAPGEGTTFRLYFPRSTTVTAADEPTTAGVQVPGGGETVLLVEDEAPVRAVLRQALDLKGFHVIEAASGDQALAAAARLPAPLHLVVTDIAMPGMNGVDLSRALVARHPEARVLFMTGHPPDSDVCRGIGATGDRCLQKPFSIDLLCRTMRNVLDGAPTLASGSHPAAQADAHAAPAGSASTHAA
ncbi:MAG: PAS domain S-box protein [Vicinamibacterales bacterium]